MADTRDFTKLTLEQLELAAELLKENLQKRKYSEKVLNYALTLPRIRIIKELSVWECYGKYIERSIKNSIGLPGYTLAIQDSIFYSLMRLSIELDHDTRSNDIDKDTLVNLMTDLSDMYDWQQIMFAIQLRKFIKGDL